MFCLGLGCSCLPVPPSVVSVCLGGWHRPECPEPGCSDTVELCVVGVVMVEGGRRRDLTDGVGLQLNIVSMSKAYY